MNDVKLKIRRSGSNTKARESKSAFVQAMNYFEKKGNESEVIDIKTGEIIKQAKPKRRQKKRTYKAIFSECGKKTRIKIMTDKSVICGIFDIPYKKVRKKIPGFYKAKVGYSFDVSKRLFDYLFDRVVTLEIFSTVSDMEFLYDRIKGWHDFRINEGYYAYSEVYG